MTATMADKHLAVPLAWEQIEAANRLHAQLPQWQRTDDALAMLKESLPGFGAEAALLKAISINSLYKTQIRAIERVADHVVGILAVAGAIDEGPDLVERMARVQLGGKRKTATRLHSFASKFAHFFISEERFPILDSFAEKVVAYHLGKTLPTKVPDDRYLVYVANLATLKELGRLSCDGRVLDRYLWLAGQYRGWLRKSKKINGECRQLFEQSSPHLAAMCPPTHPQKTKPDVLVPFISS